MALIRQFEDVLAWQQGRELTQKIDQFREGGCDGSWDFIQFFSYAKGSCGEVGSPLYIVLAADYWSEDEGKSLHESCFEICRLFNRFSRNLRDTETKGSKFKKSTDRIPTSNLKRPV